MEAVRECKVWQSPYPWGLRLLPRTNSCKVRHLKDTSLMLALLLASSSGGWFNEVVRINEGGDKTAKLIHNCWRFLRKVGHIGWLVKKKCPWPTPSLMVSSTCEGPLLGPSRKGTIFYGHECSKVFNVSVDAGVVPPLNLLDKSCSLMHEHGLWVVPPTPQSLPHMPHSPGRVQDNTCMILR